VACDVGAYTFEVTPEALEAFRTALGQIATELQLDLEDLPIAELIPLPPRAGERRHLFGRLGQFDVIHTLAQNWEGIS
jgi:hypothetical protein